MAVCSIGVSDVNSIPERVFSSAFQIFDQVVQFVGGKYNEFSKDEDDRLSLPETRIVLSIFLPIRVQQEQVKPDRLEICPKFYAAGISGRNFCTVNFT